MSVRPGFLLRRTTDALTDKRSFGINFGLGSWSPAMPFTGYRESFGPETLAVLEAAFNAAWDTVVASGVNCDQQATRTALADAIVYFASEGETDPKRLKELALAGLPRALAS
jgi:hypothetical protein